MIGRRRWIGGMASVLCTAVTPPARATDEAGPLPAAFARIEAAGAGRLGVTVLDSGSRIQAGHRAGERFPLGSTYKLLAAAAVLARVDAGQDSLDRRVRFGQDKLVTYSPITERHTGDEGMTLDAVCDAAITYSDNTAGNLLLEPLNGPAGFTTWLRGIGDGVSRLDRIEPALNEAIPGDPRDTTTPAAMLADLHALLLGQVLSAASRERLQSWLRQNRTGDKRLRANLPPGWTAGEKTGTSEHGTSNDVGLLWPPNGAAPVLVAAFLTEGSDDPGKRDAMLAAVGSAVATAWEANR